MLILSHNFQEPAFNLACEEYFLTETDCSIIILWRNKPSVIVGRNQNTIAEIDPEFVRLNDITVMRRITGGGAVFHDLGNICYTFITDHNGPIDFARFSAPIVEVLRSMGLDANMTGRNDIQIGDKKVSGTAQTVKNGRVLHHGTLLYSADLSRLAKALIVNSEKYSGRAVQSVSSRVTNISEHLYNAPDVEKFEAQLFNAILESGNNTPYSLAETDLRGITSLRTSRYDREDWTWGGGGNYNFSGSVRCPAGGLTVEMELEDGIIKSAVFTGDFFGVEDTASISGKLAGAPHKPEHLRAVFSDDVIESVFSGFTWETLRKALF